MWVFVSFLCTTLWSLDKFWLETTQHHLKWWRGHTFCRKCILFNESQTALPHLRLLHSYFPVRIILDYAAWKFLHQTTLFFQTLLLLLQLISSWSPLGFFYFSPFIVRACYAPLPLAIIFRWSTIDQTV